MPLPWVPLPWVRLPWVRLPWVSIWVPVVASRRVLILVPCVVPCERAPSWLRSMEESSGQHSSGDEVIRENRASRGTETSADVLFVTLHQDNTA